MHHVKAAVRIFSPVSADVDRLLVPYSCLSCLCIHSALLASWGKAIGMDSRRGVAVVLPPAALPYLECSNESSGQATRGWSCLFGKVPHLCTFSGLDVRWLDWFIEHLGQRSDYLVPKTFQLLVIH